MGHKHSKLKPTEMKDLRDQTSFSEADFFQYHKEFLQRYPKGKITKDQMKKEYRIVFPEGDPTPFANQLFSVYDTNNDGMIDFREFICGIGLMSRGTMDEKLRVAFRTYDLDNNGYISRWEMQSVVTAIYKTIAPLKDKKGDNLSGAAAMAIFRSMDKDRDDKVSFDEFKEGVNRDADVVRLLEAMMK